MRPDPDTKSNYLTRVLGKERHSNFAGDNNIPPHIETNAPDNIFNSIYGTLSNRFHYFHGANNIEPRLLVKSRYSGCDDLPSLKYKWLFIDSCHSGIYYSDSLSRGVFFFTYDIGAQDNDSLKRFVQAVIEGQTLTQLQTSLNDMITPLQKEAHYEYKQIEE